MFCEIIEITCISKSYKLFSFEWSTPRATLCIFTECSEIFYRQYAQVLPELTHTQILITYSYFFPLSRFSKRQIYSKISRSMSYSRFKTTDCTRRQSRYRAHVCRQPGADIVHTFHLLRHRFTRSLYIQRDPRESHTFTGAPVKHASRRHDSPSLRVLWRFARAVQRFISLR